MALGSGLECLRYVDRDPQPPKNRPVVGGQHGRRDLHAIGIWLGNPTLDPGITNAAWSMQPPVGGASRTLAC